MKPKKDNSFFWISYSDLMTSMFFIMLVLFVLMLAIFHNRMVGVKAKLSNMTELQAATEAQLSKITELEKSIKNIDTVYFIYNEEYKTHILKTQVKFKKYSSEISDLSKETIDSLLVVRDLLRNSLQSFVNKNNKASYFLIIEGQASTDDYFANNELSYQRALSLYKLWFPDSEQKQKDRTLKFFDLPCEVIIAGAGCMQGKPRASGHEDNQRFLIRILPKPGIIE